MRPVNPRVLRENGYGHEIDALSEASRDPRKPVLPPAAERLARDVLVFGRYDEAKEIVRRLTHHADAIAHPPVRCG